MGLNVITYALSKTLLEKSLDGLGVIKGSPCTLESIDGIDGGNRLTFKWKGESGAIERRHVDVANGVGIEDMKIIDEHLIIYLTDGTEIDAGELISGIKTGIWIGATTPPSDDYVLWIDPTAPEQGIPTADKIDIDSIWRFNNG